METQRRSEAGRRATARLPSGGPKAPGAAGGAICRGGIASMIRMAREPEVETQRRQDAKPSQRRVGGLAGPGGCLQQPPLTGVAGGRESRSFARPLLLSGPRPGRAAGPHTVDASASCPAFIAERDRCALGARPRWSQTTVLLAPWRLGVPSCSPIESPQSVSTRQASSIGLQALLMFYLCVSAPLWLSRPRPSRGRARRSGPRAR